MPAAREKEGALIDAIMPSGDVMPMIYAAAA